MNVEFQALSIDNISELNGGRSGLKRILLIPVLDGPKKNSYAVS